MSSFVPTRQKMESDRKQNIINKTLYLIVEKGFNSVSIADIAKATGLGPGQIYRCFQDKNDIFKQTILYIAEKRANYFKKIDHDLAYKAREISHGYSEDLTEIEMQLVCEMFKIDEHHALFEYVKYSEKILKNNGINLISMKYPNASADEVNAFAEIVATFTEGVLLRKTNGFSQGVNLQILENMFLTCLTALDQQLRDNCI